jgi:hypothetical protein
MMAQHRPARLQPEIFTFPNGNDAPRPLASNLSNGRRPRATARQQHMRRTLRSVQAIEGAKDADRLTGGGVAFA